MNSRLTTATMYGSLMRTLQASQRSMQNLQRQIASGNKYTKLSENPSAIARAQQLQSTLNVNDRYQTNTVNAITMLRYSDAAMNNVLEAAQTIRSLIIQAGDGALTSEELSDITAQIEANKKVMLDNLNTRVAGQYIFGGTDTTTMPFVMQSDGSIVYRGSDERIKYAVSESIIGEVNFSGSDIVPVDDDSYFICSHYVPLDWEWTGREEKVQITVGNRTLSVFIPEHWEDVYHDKTSTENVNYTDINGYRDPYELSGLSLQNIASIVNQALEEQGADMLVKAYIETDDENSRQQLILKSNTGEKVGITGWPDTDYMPAASVITTRDLSDVEWKSSGMGGKEGLMSRNNLLNWSGGTESITISVGDEDDVEIDLSKMKSITDLVKEINSKVRGNDDGTPFASLSSGNLDGRLILQSASGKKISVSGDTDDIRSLFGYEDIDTIDSTSSYINISSSDNNNDFTSIFFSMNDTPSDVAEKINSVNGLLSRTTADGQHIIVQATTAHVSASSESEIAALLPPLTIHAFGDAVNMFDNADDEGYITARPTTRILDHSHMDLFDVLGMETAMKSREFSMSETLNVQEDTQLHWRITSAGHTADIKLNSGSYSLQEIADRLKNAGSGWLEVTVESDKSDDWKTGTDNYEEMTERLVIRGFNGEQVIFLDMNEYNYASQLGLDTSLRTDGYTDTYAGTGTKCVNFPSAPCVDDNTGIPLRVQMNCGMFYDVTIKRSDVVDVRTGFVDRNSVMKSIVEQVNEQEGHDVMGYTEHIDSSGKGIKDSSSIYFLSGEAFTVVDMPFSDPEWKDYSEGIAAQMGIHGGITSNLRNTNKPMKDNDTFDETGTIRFSNLAHSVEIDVSSEDTVKDVVDRLRTQAGDWLYVNYYDQHMGQLAARNTGDYPLISISSIDGSAVNVLDVNGRVSQDNLGLSTGIQTRVDGGVMSGDFLWDIEEGSFPAEKLTLTVAGYSHTIDLTEIRDVTADDVIKADDIAEFVNSRMQDYDVRAEVNSDNQLMFWSMRGYALSVRFDNDGNDVTSKFMGDEPSSRTYYRGGYNLEGKASTRGVSDERYNDNRFYASGMHAQNATIRSGANTMRQNGFGVIDDVISMVNSGNRDALSDKALPKIDAFISNILRTMSENGALQARYTQNNERLITESAIMTEEYDDVAKVDPAEAISQLMVEDYIYQANLAMIARLIQPSLLDYLN